MATEKKKVAEKYHHGDLKRAILKAALELTAESGLANLSLREVARRIGVTTGAPYHHFKDRQSLLIELAIEGYASLLAALSNAAKGAGSPEGEVEAISAAYLEFGRSHQAEYAVMFSGELATHPRAGEMITIANKSLDLVRASIAKTRSLTKASAVEATFCAWSLLHGILMLDLNTVLQESKAEQDRLAIRGVLSLVRGVTA